MKKLAGAMYVGPDGLLIHGDKPMKKGDKFAGNEAAVFMNSHYKNLFEAIYEAEKPVAEEETPKSVKKTFGKKKGDSN